MVHISKCLGGTSFFLLLFHCLLQISATELGHHNVIMIGAGVASISAAAKLLTKNVSDFIILEAGSRFGGRIYTAPFDGTRVDLGAEFCHGVVGNIVYELQEPYNFLREWPADFHFIYSSGDDIDEDMSRDINKFLGKFENNEIGVDDYYISKGELFMRLYKRKIIEKYAHDPRKVQLAAEALPTMEKCICDLDGCNTWLEVAFGGNAELLEGSQHLHWAGRGYQTIIDIITQAFPDLTQELPVKQRVRYNKEVSGINYRNNLNRVLVECKDGSRYTADQVLVTPSVGVLKEDHKRLFYPELPHYKQECIQKVGFGDMMKVILHFPKKWWSKSVLKEAFIWNKKDLDAALKAFPEGRLPNNQEWLTGLYSIGSAGQNTSVIVAWFNGKIVREVEKLPDQRIVDGTMVVLRQFFGKRYDVLDPDEIIVSRWCSHPHFRGVYCFESIDALKTNRNCFEDLSKPLLNDEGKPVVLFAGEATSPNHFSTVHGSIESGLREADRILKPLED